MEEEEEEEEGEEVKGTRQSLGYIFAPLAHIQTRSNWYTPWGPHLVDFKTIYKMGLVSLRLFFFFLLAWLRYRLVLHYKGLYTHSSLSLSLLAFLVFKIGYCVCLARPITLTILRRVYFYI